MLRALDYQRTSVVSITFHCVPTDSAWETLAIPFAFANRATIPTPLPDHAKVSSSEVLSLVYIYSWCVSAYSAHQCVHTIMSVTGQWYCWSNSIYGDRVAKIPTCNAKGDGFASPSEINFLESIQSPARRDSTGSVWHCRISLWPVMSAVITSKNDFDTKMDCYNKYLTQQYTHAHTSTPHCTHNRWWLVLWSPTR